MILNSQSAEIINQFKVTNDSFRISEAKTKWEGTPKMQDVEAKGLKKGLKNYLKSNLESLKEAQELLWASDKRSILIVLQAMDAAGKDSTIKHVMSGVNPQGVTVNSFKAPNTEELEHNWLWRYTKRMPERGKIGIFNRSYYEEVLVVKVHPEFLAARPLPTYNFDQSFWDGRYTDVNNMEAHLTRSGTTILKFFLHVSQEEQKNRFLDRLNEPDKLWKFSEGDMKERALWPKYMQAFEEAIRATSTPESPWYVIPADDKWKMRALVSMIIRDTISNMDLKFPVVDESEKARFNEIRKELLK